MRATSNESASNNTSRLQNSLHQQQVEENQHQQHEQYVAMHPNDYLVPLVNNNATSSGTNFGSNHLKSSSSNRYHPYARNSTNDNSSPASSTIHSSSSITNNENQYARTIHNNQTMQSINFSNNRAVYDVRMENDENIRNMLSTQLPQFTPTSTTTLLEPSVQVEPHFDTNIFIMRKRRVVSSSSSSLSSMTSEMSTRQAANYGTGISRCSSTSLSSLESPNIEPSPSLRTLSTDTVTYRNSHPTSSNRGGAADYMNSSSPNYKYQESSTTHLPPSLTALGGDNFKNKTHHEHYVNELPQESNFNSPPLITQNYSLTPLNLLQKNSTTVMNSSSSSAANNMELVSSSGQYLEPGNPSSYLRPLKSASSNDLSNQTPSSATPFSDAPIVLDLSKIPSTFDEASSNFNYSKTKRIKNFVNDGPWTSEEHERLLYGLQQCGPNWKELSEVYVKSRTRVQVHAYATKVLKIKSPNNDP